MNRYDRNRPFETDGYTLVELLIAIAIVSVLAGILLPALGRAREGARRATCASNLKQWGTIFHLYSAEQSGRYPALQRIWPGMRTELLGPDLRALYPEYLTRPALLHCPSDPGMDSSEWARSARPFDAGLVEIRRLIASGQAHADCLVAHLSMPRSYIYFGYAVSSGTAAEIAWQGVDEAGRMVRDFFPELGSIRNGNGDLSDFRLAVGNVCPYNGAFFSTESESWSGMYEVPSGLVWDYGASGLGGNPRYTTPAGDVRTHFAAEADRVIGIDHRGVPVLIPEILYRLRDGVARMLITDINRPERTSHASSTLPVMMDGWGQGKRISPGEEDDPLAGVLQFNHLPGGANVLYMDGHVEFVGYGDRFPVRVEAFGEGRNWHESIADGMMGG